MVAASQKLPYNRQILRWARERRRLDRTEAARRAASTPEQIAEWEQGASVPTVRQARILASVYDRPFLEFFSLKIPEVVPPTMAPDFRFHHRGPGDAEIAALEAIQEWAESQRLNAIDLYEGLGEEAPSFPDYLKANVDGDPAGAAERARLHLGFPITRQLSMKAAERKTFPAPIRRLIESTGVLVFKHSGLRTTRTRGICFYNNVLPVIVYGNEAPGGQVFTLMHEFGHVMLGQSALSGSPIIAFRHGSRRRRVEGWCNAFAAAFLMPEEAVRSHPDSPKEFSYDIQDSQLKALAESFSVSRHAMLIRLVSLGLIDARYYWRVKRQEFLLQEAGYKGEGRPKYYGSRYRSMLGDHYTKLVLESLETGRLGYHSASEFMGIKNVRHLRDIRDYFDK